MSDVIKCSDIAADGLIFRNVDALSVEIESVGDHLVLTVIGDTSFETIQLLRI